MGREDVHRFHGHCLISMILMVLCLNGLSRVKAVETTDTLLNETEDNELLTLDNSVSNVDIEDESKNSHLTNKEKPSKFDIDVSDMIYMDPKNHSDIKSQTDTKNNAKKIPCRKLMSMDCLGKNLSIMIDKISEAKTLNITDSVQILKKKNITSISDKESLFDKVHRFAKNHVMKISIDKDLLDSKEPRTFFGAAPPAALNGQNPFLTGFGLGFLAFGLKKLLLPLMIGVQIVKTMLIALFLPSIIGSIGKIVGKGVSSFAESSQGATAAPEENFEFKDNSDLYSEDYMSRQPLGTLPASAMYDEGMLMPTSQKPDSRFSYGANTFNDRYYTRHIINSGLSKKNDFKVFHEIPTSSLLLTNYDPFYSPLLSRLDAVFLRLGHTTEGCREYVVCAMYRSPARFAPYSNLVSAQLSRELNELRRPSSDNPDVLRFFRYMKSAKDGQDNVKCEEAYPMCDVPRDDPSMRQNQAMLATYQDIDKLVHARKL